MSEKPNSLKQAFQSMIPESIGLVEGIVVSTAPLSIQIVNNPKMVVSGSLLIIPRHLTDYQTKISFDNPGIKNVVKPYSMDDEAGNDYKLTFQEAVQNEVTVYNSLKMGEKVYMLRFAGGKQYYVLDRVVG